MTIKTINPYSKFSDESKSNIQRALEFKCLFFKISDTREKMIAVGESDENIKSAVLPFFDTIAYLCK